MSNQLEQLAHRTVAALRDPPGPVGFARLIPVIEERATTSTAAIARATAQASGLGDEKDNGESDMDQQTDFRANAKAELKALKNALDKTPFGPKLVGARKHFLGAVMAFATKDDARCRRELDAAVRSYFL